MKNSPDLQPAAPYNAADYCSTKEAAAVLGVSHRTVQLWVESGTLQAWRTAGGHRRITLESVNRLVEGRRIAIAAHAPPPAAPVASASSTRRVLVVDDDPLMLRLYELEMAGWGMDLNVVKANNGFEALIRIGEERPDLLVSDLNMPGMDGFRMIRTLREDSGSAGMSMIVVSGLDRATIKAMGLPADIPVFPKPVPFGELRAAVEHGLARA
ncbi:MAG: response regulator [Massilia sp.]|jgi:excisionase family DNA binding protein|uniref:response regulator n=1 Tax=Massilia sp. TaxID=1882437 RepID=UPI0019B09AD8|nr:response regulator [Oxalobacteraceae sp. CFBP 8761]MBD8628614.1 response regulator [Oxalobacteraceae sp. CFBP 8753]MBD8633045.1 response regulator [Oxalobacteraceae sp. CFBP 8755]MBD8721996.1 response regulator [Oxalobacteraceae sp. CFBP 13708]